LDCSFGTLGGSSACNSNGDTLNCCPAGQHQSNGTCVPGVANPCTSVGTGLSCGEFGVNGSISCTGNQFNSNGSTNTNAAINCCPAGKVYTYQGCVSQTQANSNCLPPSVLVTGDTGETVCVPYGNCQHHGGNCYVENGIGVNDGVDLAAGQSAVVCDNKGHWTTCAQGYQCNGLASNGGDCVPITHTGGGTTPPGSGNPTGQCMNVTAYNEAWSPLSGAQLANLTSGSVVNFCVIGSTTGGTFDRAQFKVNSTLEPETTTHRPTSTDFCQSYTITPTDTTVSVKAKIHHATLNTWFGESI